jgi:CBS domain-containing protein
MDTDERFPTIAGLVPITDIMSRHVVTARPDEPVASIIDKLRRHGCVPVVDAWDRPTGIVTKLDVVECLGEPRARACDVMMPLAMSLDIHATAAQAAALMSAEGIHHVLVVDEDRELVGVVSSLDIARWLAANDGFCEAPPTATR